MSSPFRPKVVKPAEVLSRDRPDIISGNPVLIRGGGEEDLLRLWYVPS